MLFSINELVKHWCISPRSVLHIGAHLAEECDLYRSVGWDKVIWIEANPELINDLRKKVEPLGHRVYEAAVWNTTGEEVSLKVASNGQSSSLFEFNKHSTYYPKIVVDKEIVIKTQRVDSILTSSETPDFCNLDIQGAELAALEGLGEYINKLNAIYTEVNKVELYRGCALIDDIDYFLGKAGFKRVATRWMLGFGWGDALYLRQGHNLHHRLKGIHYPIYFYLKQLPSVLSRLSPKFTH